MLLKDEVIEGIKAGRITVLFRRWSRPGARSGGTQMTQGGVIGIDSVEVVSEDAVTDLDAREAGYASREDLLSHLNYRDDPIYRVRVVVQWNEEARRRSIVFDTTKLDRRN